MFIVDFIKRHWRGLALLDLLVVAIISFAAFMGYSNDYPSFGEFLASSCSICNSGSAPLPTSDLDSLHSGVSLSSPFPGESQVVQEAEGCGCKGMM